MSQSFDLIAAADENKKVLIWKCEANPSIKFADRQHWELRHDHQFDVPAWKVSWAPVGQMLAASIGDNQTVVFKLNKMNETWEKISEISEDGQLVDQDEPQKGE